MIPLSFYSIPLLMATAFVIAAAGLKKDRFAPYIAFCGFGITLALALVTVSEVASSGAAVYQAGGWPAPLGISIVVDQLSAVFVVLVSVISFLAVIFSKSYIRNRRSEYYAILCLVVAGLLGIIQTGDIFNMFVFFEVMSVSSYAFVAFYRNKKALEAGIKYLFMGAFATSLILFGVALLYGAFGTLNMADLALRVPGYSGWLLPVAVGLMMTGFALKSGLVPFHTWLPDAHPAAPAPVSAILSGIVIKGGLYCIIRLVFTILGAPSVMLNILLVIGVLSMLVGGLLALMQTDLKRLLAYSSISQMGYVALALSLGTQLGISGALFHAVNHAVIKSLLFLCTGVILYHTRTSDLYEIAGTLKPNRTLTYAFLIGVLSLGGIPLFNGFASKWMIYTATFQVNPLLTLFAILMTVMTLAYGLKAFYMVFMTNPNPSAAKVKIPLTMAIPLIVLAAACVVLGLLPLIGYSISDFAMLGLSGQAYMEAVLG